MIDLDLGERDVAVHCGQPEREPPLARALPDDEALSLHRGVRGRRIVLGLEAEASRGRHGRDRPTYRVSGQASE